MTVYINKQNTKFYRIFNSEDLNIELQHELTSDYNLRFYYDGFIDGGDFNGEDDFVQNLLDLPASIKTGLARRLNDYWRTEFINQPDEIEDTLTSINNFHDLEITLDYLKTHRVHNFDWWYVRGYAQGEVVYAWTFNKFNETQFMKDLNILSSGKFYDFNDYLTNIFFNSFIEIRSCNEFGEISYDDEPIYVAGFYADSDTIDNQHDPDIDKFMLTNFDAIPAKVKVRYY